MYSIIKQNDNEVTIKVTWEIDDGYVGGSRPHETIIDFDIEDWKELTEEQLEEQIDDAVEDDFNDKITFIIT